MSWSRQMVCESIVTAEEISELHRLASFEPVCADTDLELDPLARDVETRLLRRTSDTQFIYNLLTDVISLANRQFGYHVERIDEPLRYLAYGVGGHITWHTDSGYGDMAKRKLSASLLLSHPDEYDGGALEFCPGGSLKNGHSAGSVIVFPSYMAHRVTPVTRGRRVALVAWMYGREFI